MLDQLEFVSSTVRIYTEDEVRLIAFGNDDTSPDRYLVISRYDDPSAEDQPRDDMVGIDTSTSAYEVPSAISSIVVGRDFLELGVAPQKMEAVGTARVVVTYRIDDDTYELLREYLHAIVHGTNIELNEKH